MNLLSAALQLDSVASCGVFHAFCCRVVGTRRWSIPTKAKDSFWKATPLSVKKRKTSRAGREDSPAATLGSELSHCKHGAANLGVMGVSVCVCLSGCVAVEIVPFELQTDGGEGGGGVAHLLR